MCLASSVMPMHCSDDAVPVRVVRSRTTPARPTPARAAACLLLAASLAWSASSRADKPQPEGGGRPGKADSEAKVDIPALIRVGDRARNAGKWERAEEVYRLAYLLGGDAKILCEWGMASLALRRHLDAADHLDECLKDPSTGTAAERRRYASGLEKARREVGQIDIELNQMGAELSVGGRVRGKSATTRFYVYTEPGTQTIKATLPGFLDAEQTVHVEKGKSIKAVLRLVEKPKEAPPAPALASNKVTRNTAATKAKAPVDRAPPGPWDGMAGIERICGIGVTTFGITGGLIASVLASRYRADAEQRSGALLRQRNDPSICASPSPEHAGACSAIDDRYDAHDISQNVATGFFIGAGIVGAATLGSFVYHGFEHGRQPIRIMPMVAGNGAGAVVEGSF
jgi:hypothetical protein